MAGHVRLFSSGDLNLAKAVREVASNHHAVLLANHGPLVAGNSLSDAVYAMEELEETAKLYLMLKDLPTSFLTEDQIRALQKKFKN